jgi:hypothetical protein
MPSERNFAQSGAIPKTLLGEATASDNQGLRRALKSIPNCGLTDRKFAISSVLRPTQQFTGQPGVAKNLFSR